MISRKIFWPVAVACVIFLSCNVEPKIKVNLNGLKVQDSIRSFTIYNPGGKELVLEDFTSSCECTALNLHKGQEILPDDSLNVKVRINKREQDVDNTVFITMKTNAKPRLTSFHFKP